MNRRIHFPAVFILPLIPVLLMLPFRASGATWDATNAVRAVAQVLGERYGDEAEARRYESGLLAHLSAGRYAGVTDGEPLAHRLTADLQAIHPDRHLRVRFSPEPLPPADQQWTPSEEDRKNALRRERRANVGFVKAEVLPGNVGYLQFHYFGDPDLGAPKLAAAMTFLADADALILDLRHNGGATHPELMSLLTRYLVPASQVVSTRIQWRGTPPSFMTQPRELPVQGRTDFRRPVYLLTSGVTFSGAEAFAYDLQAMKRAVVVGERTGGGANPGGEVRAGDHFAVWVPFGMSVHPTTGTNWEGTGVRPDVAVRSELALLTAHAAALEALRKTPGLEPDWKAALDAARESIQRELSAQPPRVPVAFQLAGFEDAREVYVVGDFNGWSPRRSPLSREGGRWTGQAEVEPGRREYKFWVDGLWLPDPSNGRTRIDEQGNTNSVIEVTAR